jgi:hypothetical protein
VKVIPGPHSQRRKGRRWVLPAALCGVGAAAILTVIITFATMPTNKPVAPETQAAPMPVASQPEEAPKHTEFVVTREPFDAIEAAVNARTITSKTPDVVPVAKDHFEDIPPEGALLVGLEIGVANFLQNDRIDYLRPIYLTEHGRKYGPGIGTRTDKMVTLRARPGFAVSGITLRGGLWPDGLLLTFREVGKHGLEKAGTYQSDWVGGHGGIRESKVSGEGKFFIGIVGTKMKEGKPGNVGLVFFSPDNVPPD